jgi:two-component system chemotaxis sensor kinase CheA
MSIRMLPVANVFSKFPRLVRDLARKSGKQIDLVIQGQETELDRSVIDEIADPLIHLIRNAADHGLETPAERRKAGKPETGTIRLTARHEQGRILITVADDGRGIDRERVRQRAVEKELITEKEAAILSDDEALDLIFLSGLSTAERVSEVSGRGVGMDIVRSNIERVNGAIQIETSLGQGTCFTIDLPLTLAIVPSLLVRVGRSIFALPLVAILETLRIQSAGIQTIRSRPVILLREQVLPVIQLAQLFNLASTRRDAHQYVVVARSAKSSLGLVVDDLIGEEEVVVKSLGGIIGEIPGISSAAILGDGQVALIVDVQGIFKLASAAASISHTVPV